MFREHL